MTSKEVNSNDRSNCSGPICTRTQSIMLHTLLSGCHKRNVNWLSTATSACSCNRSHIALKNFKLSSYVCYGIDIKQWALR